MVSKRKFKRDYIILEAKDMNFRSKERVLPKAFAKIEINDEKSVVALYVENLKNLKDPKNMFKSVFSGLLAWFLRKDIKEKERNFLTA